jgi:hypothetical protein
MITIRYPIRNRNYTLTYTQFLYIPLIFKPNYATTIPAIY